jgi:hypothetical protein
LFLLLLFTKKLFPFFSVQVHAPPAKRDLDRQRGLQTSEEGRPLGLGGPRAHTKERPGRALLRGRRQERQAQDGGQTRGHSRHQHHLRRAVSKGRKLIYKLYISCFRLKSIENTARTSIELVA